MSKQGSDKAQTPFVSVILPVYNEAGFIEPCLRSLLENTYPPDRVEILVIDGRSTDGTPEVVRELADKDRRIRLIDNPERFLAHGINIGIREARGDLLTRVDGHATVAPDFIERSVKALREHPDAWCAGGPVTTFATTFMGTVIATAMSIPVGAGGAAYRTGKVEGYVDTILGGTYRKEVFDKIGLLDESFIRNQDDDLHIRIHKAGGRFYITPKVKSRHYARSSLWNAAQQFFQFGYWRVPVILKHGHPATVRQTVPFFFVLGWIVLIIGALIWHPLVYGLAGYAVLYLLVLLAGVAQATLKHSFLVGICSPIVFPVLHFSYGLGNLWAILRFVILRRPIKGDQGAASLKR